MKFDVEIQSLKGTARLEIKTIEEDNGWAAYLSIIYDRNLKDTCLLLGRSGLPHRFTGPSENEAEEAAKEFLQENYHVVRTIW